MGLSHLYISLQVGKLGRLNVLWSSWSFGSGRRKTKRGITGVWNRRSQDSQVGFMCCLTRRGTDSAIYTGWKGQIILPRILFRWEPNLQSYSLYKESFGRETILLSAHLDLTYWKALGSASTSWSTDWCKRPLNVKPYLFWKWRITHFLSIGASRQNPTRNSVRDAANDKIKMKTSHIKTCHKK